MGGGGRGFAGSAATESEDAIATQVRNRNVVRTTLRYYGLIGFKAIPEWESDPETCA